MFCQKCGAKNEDEASFCTGCGQPLMTEEIACKNKTILSSSNKFVGNPDKMKLKSKLSLTVMIAGGLLLVLAIAFTVLTVLKSKNSVDTPTTGNMGENINYKPMKISDVEIIDEYGKKYLIGKITKGKSAIEFSGYYAEFLFYNANNEMGPYSVIVESQDAYDTYYGQRDLDFDYTNLLKTGESIYFKEEISEENYDYLDSFNMDEFEEVDCLAVQLSGKLYLAAKEASNENYEVSRKIINALLEMYPDNLEVLSAHSELKKLEQSETE